MTTCINLEFMESAMGLLGLAVFGLARIPIPLCISGRRACPPEDCGGPWRFMALRQHYSMIQIMERCFEIIEDTELEDHVEELYTLRYWLNVDRFDRKAVNKRLFDYARGENVFDWI